MSLQEFAFDEWDQLCDKLTALATDCNKHRAKTDKRKQRSVFRDVLKAVEVSARCQMMAHSFASQVLDYIFRYSFRAKYKLKGNSFFFS